MEFRFNHIGITVSDLDKSIDFYRTLFDLEPGLYVDIITKTSPEGSPSRSQRVAFVPIGESGLIELHEFSPTRTPLEGQLESVGYAYLCLEVDDLEATYKRLQESGATFMAPLRQIFVEALPNTALPPSEVDDLRPLDTPMYQKVCDVFDPDGKRVELVENDRRLKTPAIHRNAQGGFAVRDRPHVVRTYEAEVL
jgi:catechol 2,3-dioxygenase-like lactoylglutathione lyase family enzyme